MSEVSSKEYPQMVSEEVKDETTGLYEAVKGLSQFKKGNNVVFMKPQNVLSTNIENNKIKILCTTKGYSNRLVYTHETSMHQFKKMDNETGELNIEIDVWSDSIFRVRFGKNSIPKNESEFPNLESRMLVGKSEEKIQIECEENDTQFLFKTNKITIIVEKTVFKLKAYDKEGNLFWEQCHNDLSTSDIFDISISEDKGNSACFESFTLLSQEEIFGLGERFDHVARRGKHVDFWNKDAIGTSNSRSYINVPFLFSTRGYGLFLNSSCRTEWEIGTLDASTLGFAIEDGIMDYFIIYGPTPSEIIFNYCTLTGFSPIPPIWSFGLWMSRNSYLSWDVVNEVADKMREKDIPADVLHLDTAWFKEDWNCDLKFSEERFPSPEENMRSLIEKGFRISLWQYNFIPPKENNDNYMEGLEKGYFVMGENGKLYTLPEHAVGSWLDDAIIDFSNTEASNWYAKKIKDLIKKGAATIKTDFGEGIPENGIYKNIDGKRFHNLYSLVYNSIVAKAINEVSGENIVWARSGTAGSQRYPIHWNGDSQCSFAGLAGTVRGGLSLGLSGFSFYSSDIGGFIGRPSTELYIRWAQVGLFLSHSRCHGCGNDNSREPWSFGEDAERIFRKYAKLRYSLMPYIYNEAIKSSKSGKPMVRALLIDYPGDRNVWYIDDQYLFGDSFMIAPILEPLEVKKTRCLYLPKGIWTDYWTKNVINSSGIWINREIDLETMPVYVKESSVIAYEKEKSHTENEIGNIARIELYSCKEGRFDFSFGSKFFSVMLKNDKVKIEGLEYRPEIVIYDTKLK